MPGAQPPVMPWQGEALGLCSARRGPQRMRGCWPLGVLPGAPSYVGNLALLLGVGFGAAPADTAPSCACALQQEPGSITVVNAGHRRLLRAALPDDEREQWASPGLVKALSQEAEWPMRASSQAAPNRDEDR